MKIYLNRKHRTIGMILCTSCSPKSCRIEYIVLCKKKITYFFTYFRWYFSFTYFYIVNSPTFHLLFVNSPTFFMFNVLPPLHYLIYISKTLLCWCLYLSFYIFCGPEKDLDLNYTHCFIYKVYFIISILHINIYIQSNIYKHIILILHSCYIQRNWIDPIHHPSCSLSHPNFKFLFKVHFQIGPETKKSNVLLCFFFFCSATNIDGNKWMRQP